MFYGAAPVFTRGFKSTVIIVSKYFYSTRVCVFDVTQQLRFSQLVCCWQDYYQGRTEGGLLGR